ncbi:MAG: hypothetical protein QW091_00175 [Candidatus Micrarchaeaceae archaeon]
MGLFASLFLEFVPIALGLIALQFLRSLKLSKHNVTISFDVAQAFKQASDASILYASRFNSGFLSLSRDLLIANGLGYVKSSKAVEKLGFEKLGLLKLSNPVLVNNMLLKQKHGKINIYANADALFRCAISPSSPLLLAYMIGYDFGVLNV